ncbi:MAG: hypothetical protein KJS68_12155 [Alphaproteobacteria bacterium]|nr:hypothetical protein [Alphaproteobacteria bacterium]MDE2496043.1 hypothetical protein [Alphaproteobacteria bacterium]
MLEPLVASANLIFWPWRFATLATHHSIERGEIRAVSALGEEGCRVHGCELFGNGGCHELIDADAVRFGPALDFRLYRARQAEWVGTLGALHVLILLSISTGDSTSIPNVAGASPKSRWLNVTIAMAEAFQAVTAGGFGFGRSAWLIGPYRFRATR